MRSTVVRFLTVAVALAIGLCAVPVTLAGPEDPIDEPDCTTQTSPLGGTSLVVLNADEDADSVSQQVEPEVTALLTMTDVDEDEECTVIVTALSPKTECTVVTTESEE